MPETETYALIPLPKVKKLLEEDEKRAELSYEKKLALDHAKNFSRLNQTDHASLVKDLMGSSLLKEKMTESIAMKLAEQLPESPNEVRPFFTKERYTLEKNEIEEILTLLKKYSG